MKEKILSKKEFADKIYDYLDLYDYSDLDFVKIESKGRGFDTFNVTISTHKNGVELNKSNIKLKCR